MNTNPTPRHPAVRVIGLALVIAGLSAGTTLLAQDSVPPVPALAEPAAEAPAPIPPPPQPPPPTVVPAQPPPSLGAPVPRARAVEPPVPPPASGGGAAGVVPDRSVRATPRRVSSGGPVGLPASEEGAPRAAARAGTTASAGTSSTSRLGGSALPPRDRRTRNVARAAVDEDLSGDPQEAAAQYEAIVADFDHQRENAAQAILRLGEAYRKLGRLEEARVQFARILREFVDFPDLTRLSQQQLAQNAPREGRAGNLANPGNTAAAPAPATEELRLLEEELSLLGQQLARAQELVKTGTTPDSSLFPIQRDILHIKQQLARLSNANQNSNRNGPSANLNSGGTGGMNARQVVTVSGNIRQPGIVVFRPGMRICDAIGERGGVDRSADAGRVRLRRKGGQNVEIDLSDIFSHPDNNVTLEAGDEIIVPSSPPAKAETDPPVTASPASDLAPATPRLPSTSRN